MTAISTIIDAVAEHYNVSSADILSRRQTRMCAVPRWVAMYLVREHSKLSYEAIGRCFDRDHSTVMYGICQVQEKMKDNEWERLNILHLQDILDESIPLLSEAEDLIDDMIGTLRASLLRQAAHNPQRLLTKLRAINVD